MGWAGLDNKQPVKVDINVNTNVNTNVNEELSRRGSYVEKQGGADLSLGFQCLPRVRGRDGRSIEAGAARMGSACSVCICEYVVVWM